MEGRELQCSFNANVKQDAQIGNEENSGSHVFFGHVDNSLHEQLLLSLPRQSNELSPAYHADPRLVDTVTVMSDSLGHGECQLGSSSSQILVQDADANAISINTSIEDPKMEKCNTLGRKNIPTQSVIQQKVEGELAGIDDDNSKKLCEIDQSKPMDLEGGICVKIDLEDIDSTSCEDDLLEGKTPTEPAFIIAESEPNIKERLRTRQLTNTKKSIVYVGKEGEDKVCKGRSRTKPKLKKAQLISDDEFEKDETSEDDRNELKKCVVCLRHREFVDAIFEESKELQQHVEVMLGYVDIQIEKFSNNIGICAECYDRIQNWHIFYSAITRRHETALSNGEKFIDEPVPFEAFQARVYKNFKKMNRVKEVYLSATHSHYARRHLSERDWDYFCDHLFHSNSVKSERSKELEKFLISTEKLSQLYCTKCKKLIPGGKSTFKDHMETVHQENPVMYPCDICGVLFPDKDMTASTEDYYPHWISHFYFNKCEDCGKSFPTKRALGQHRHAVHRNRQVECDRCGKILANKMSLDLHLIRHLPENEKKQYMAKCSICKKRIAQWNMKSHLATHKDERPWKCDHCDATFKMKGALVAHRDVVHFNLKNHVCSICGEAFKSASSLRVHIRRHEGRKDYKCDVCFKEYYTYSALKGHKICHQTTRDFVCEVCGKAFKKKKSLEEHITIHTGVKQHQCPICGREIRVKSNLYKHMKIHKKPPDNTSVKIKTHKSRKSLVGNSEANNPGTKETLHLESAHLSTSTNELLVDRKVVLLAKTLSSCSALSGISVSEGNSYSSTLDMNSTPFALQSLQQHPSYVTTQFQTNEGTAVHAKTMQNQHQDLLSVPISAHYFPAGQTYFTGLDD